MISIKRIRHNRPNPPGFCLDIKEGRSCYTFVHFITSINIKTDGVISKVPEHTCIIYRPYTPQYFSCPDGMIHDWFHFNCESEQILNDINIPLDVPFVPKQWYFITELVGEMEREFSSKKENYQLLIDIKIKELFIKLSRSLHNYLFELNDTRLIAAFSDLRNKMMMNLSHPWTVEEMAREISLSKSRFASLYHDFYGTSPINDLIRTRIDAAKDALLFTDKTVEEIAQLLGYANVTHFYRQFRQITGVSPLAFKNHK